MSEEKPSSRLARLKAMRDSGILSTSVDGVSTSFRSAEDLQQAIMRLERELGYRKPRVRSRSVFLGHR